jgi:hypothetical protein
VVKYGEREISNHKTNIDSNFVAHTETSSQFQVLDNNLGKLEHCRRLKSVQLPAVTVE